MLLFPEGKNRGQEAESQMFTKTGAMVTVGDDTEAQGGDVTCSKPPS